MMNGRARVTIPVRKALKNTKTTAILPTTERNRGKLTRATKNARQGEGGELEVG
jgi:hypothetical protein